MKKIIEIKRRFVSIDEYAEIEGIDLSVPINLGLVPDIEMRILKYGTEYVYEKDM